MSRATPQMRDFSQSLIAYETMENKFSKTKIPVACRVSEKLRPHLTTLMGNVGFRALLLRALALANPEVAWLRTVQVTADGFLEGFDEIETQVDPDEIFEGCVVLAAQLLGLLVVLIGEGLTLRLVREAWPKVSLKHLDFGQRE